MRVTVSQPSPIATSSEATTPPSAGGRLVAADGRSLPLQGTRLVADAQGGCARVLVEQRFVNAYTEPLSVTYLLPLPADGAVAGFSFVLDGARTLGRVEKRADAREAFEQAIAEGRSAALLEEERSSVFRQEIGNLPPGKELRIEVLVDQPLVWLCGGEWEWRFPCVSAPRYLGGDGRVPDAERLVVEVLDGGAEALGARLTLALSLGDRLGAGKVPYSPSHGLAVRETPESGRWSVALGGDEHAPLDRDVVVRWSVAAAEPGVSCAREGAYALITVVPPEPSRALSARPRDLIVLIDASGSMGGAPLEQAKRVVSALVRGLDERDTLELLSFNSTVTRFAKKPVAATEATRGKALKWLSALSASGSTEMRAGIASALAGVRSEAERQVLLITDGFIGFETQVIRTILERLPAGSRLHTLGIGSSVNRSLTGPAARAGGGTEHIVGIDEEVEPVLARLLGKLEAPVLTSLQISGPALSALGRERLPDLHAGSPVLIPVELAPCGGRLLVEGTTAEGALRWELDVPERAIASGPEEARSTALAAWFGRERVEELELRRAAGEEGARLDREIERLGLAFQIATRLTSWVAVCEEPSVDPTKPARRVVQPHALPYGVSAEGIGLRAARPRSAMLSHASGVAFALGAAALSPPPSPPFPTRARRAPSAPARAPTELSGKITVSGERTLGIVIDLAQDFAWERPERVTLELADGRSMEVEVDAKRSTASAPLSSGQTIRLWLVLEGLPAAEPVALFAGSLHIALTR